MMRRRGTMAGLSDLLDAPKHRAKDVVGIMCSHVYQGNRDRSFRLTIRSLLLVAVFSASSALTSAPAQASTTTDQAVAWAKGYLNQDYDVGLCLTFVHDAYYYGAGIQIGYPPSSNQTAVGYWDSPPSGSTEHSGDANPPAGALVFWGATSGNSAGHVGLSLGSGNIISTESYPQTTNDPNAVHEFSISARNAAGYPYLGWLDPPGVDLSGGGGGGVPANGTYVSYNGNGYAIAGGAPLYVSNWAAVGNPTVTAINSTQWGDLNSVPADGTLLNFPGVGSYEVAGGAPMYVSNYAAIGSPGGGVTVDPWDLQNITNPAAHLNSVPADGTLLNFPGVGSYEVAGGAPMYVSNYAAIGSPGGGVTVDPWDLQNITNPAAHLNSVPADGTLLNFPGVGSYEVAGGAPMYVSNYAAIGSPGGGVTVDPWDLQNITNPAAHLNSVPADGTLLNFPGVGSYEVAGGAPMYVSNYAAIGSPGGGVTVDPWDLQNITNPAAHLNSVPADGTQLNASGSAYVVAGGAALPVSTCTVGSISFCNHSVTIDLWDIENVSNPSAHLNSAPIDGTVIETLPSNRFWEFHIGGWLAVSSLTSSTAVTDASLSTYPFDASPSINSASSASVVVGVPGSFSISATGFPVPVITETGALPTGMSFSNGSFSGSPAPGSAATYPITISASNGISPDATQSFTLTVRPIGITTTSLPSGSIYTKTNKVTYSVTLAAERWQSALQVVAGRGLQASLRA